MATDNSDTGNKSIAELQAFLEASPQLEFAEAFVVDINGIMRGKRLPITSCRRYTKTDSACRHPRFYWTYRAGRSQRPAWSWTPETAIIIAIRLPTVCVRCHGANAPEANC